MNKQVVIDAKANRLIMRCPFWANDLINDIPSRRWSKSDRVWLIPLTRKNVEYLRERVIKKDYAMVTHEAERLMKKLEESVERGRARPGFPAWYKFKTEPRRHQRMALEKLYGLEASALFMVMGTGKTKVWIDIGCCLRMEGKIDSMLVVTKLSVRRTWANEFRIHAPIEARLFLPDSADDPIPDGEFVVAVIGVESLSQGRMRELADRFVRVHTSRCFMVVDECHLISNHRAIRAEVCVDVGKNAAFRSGGSGTPVDEGPMDLFMQFEFLDPNIIGIGDFYAFRNQYAVMGGYRPKEGKMKGRPTQIVGYQNLEELTRAIAPVTFEVGKEVLDLPPKEYTRRYVQLTPKQKALYDQIKKEKEYEWKGQPVVVKNVLELALRLHQVVGGYTVTRRVDARGKERSEPHHVISDEQNPKVNEVVDIAEEAGKKQGICWCVYKTELAAVANALRAAGKRVGEIYGDIPERERAATVARFQSGEIDWIVGNAATGGVGITLTRAELVVYFSNTFAMVDRVQSEDRAHRIGQSKTVLYVDIVAERTIDEAILQALEDKVDLAAYVRSRLRDAMKIL